MSLELLQKSLNLVNEGDGIDIGKKKNKNKKKVNARKRMIDEGKRLLKQVDLDKEFDVDSCEVVRAKKNKRSNVKRQELERSDRLAREGYSLVEQVRDQRPPDLMKRNLKYLKYVESRRMDDDIMARITNHHLKAADRRKKLVKEICDARDGKRKKKIVQKSVFSEQDFANASGPMAHVLNHKSNKVVLDKKTGRPIPASAPPASLFDDVQDEDGTFLNQMGDRRKGDAKSASSARAAEHLRAQGHNVAFVGFGSATNIFQQGTEKLTTEIDAEIRAAFGKLTKKDRRTREGAMDTLSKILQTKSEEEVKCSFSYYAGNYSTFVTDSSATFRSEASNVLKVYIKKLQKGIQEELKNIMPLVLFSTYDAQSTVAKSANAVLNDCFDKAKRTKIRKAFAQQTVDLVLEIINRTHKLIQPQKFVEDESDADRASRLIAQGLAVLHDQGETADQALLNELTTNTAVIARLLPLPENVRSSLFLLLTRLLKSDVDAFFETKIPSAVLSSLDNRHATLSRNAFECFLVLAKTDRFFEVCKIEKAVIPKFVSMIRKKDRHWLVLETYLLPSFALIYNHLPTDDQKSNFVKSAFESFFDGNVLENAFPVGAWANAFGELVKFCFVHSEAEKDREVIFAKLLPFLDMVIDSGHEAALTSASSLLLWLHKKDLVNAKLRETLKMNLMNKLPSSSSLLEMTLPSLGELDSTYVQDFMKCLQTPNLLLLKLLPCCENKSQFISAKEFANRIEREENKDVRLDLLSALIEFLDSEDAGQLDTLLRLENISTSCEVIVCLGKSQKAWNSCSLKPDLRSDLLKRVMEHILVHKEPSAIWNDWSAVVDAYKFLEPILKNEFVKGFLPILEPKDVGRFSDLLNDGKDEELNDSEDQDLNDGEEEELNAGEEEELNAGKDEEVNDGKGKDEELVEEEREFSCPRVKSGSTREKAQSKLIHLLLNQPLGTEISCVDVQKAVETVSGFQNKPPEDRLQNSLDELFNSNVSNDHLSFVCQVVLKSGLYNDALTDEETFVEICVNFEYYAQYCVSNELGLLPLCYHLNFGQWLDDSRPKLCELIKRAYFAALLLQNHPELSNEWSIALIVISTALGAFVLEKKFRAEEDTSELDQTIEELITLIAENSWDKRFVEDVNPELNYAYHFNALRFLLDNEKFSIDQSVQKKCSELARDPDEMTLGTFIALRVPITEEFVNMWEELSDRLEGFSYGMKLAWRLESTTTCGQDLVDLKNIHNVVESHGLTSFLFSYEERGTKDDTVYSEATEHDIVSCAMIRCLSQIIWLFPDLSPELRDFVDCATVTVFDVISNASEVARDECMFDMFVTMASRLYRAYLLTAKHNSEKEDTEWVNIRTEWQDFIFPSCNSSIVSFFLHTSNLHLGTTVPYLAEELSRTVRCMESESFRSLTLPRSLEPTLDQLKYSEQLQNVLSPVMRLICDSPKAPVTAQLAAVHILSSLMPDMFEHENKEFHDSEKQNEVEVASYRSRKFKLPYKLKEILQTINTSCLEQSQSGNIPPAILVWDALMDYALLLDAEQKFTFCRALELDMNKTNGELIAIITTIYTRLPDVPKNEEAFVSKPTIEQFDLNRYYCNLFYRTVNAIPAHVRDWANSLSKSHFNIVSKFIQQYISPLMSRRELENISEAAKIEKRENLKVKVMPAINQITAQYQFEDSAMVLNIVIPPDYPLSLPSLNYEKKMLEAEKQRKWLVKLVAFLTHQNGSMWDGVNQWRRSIEDHMEGVEECLICFSTVSADNFQIPKIKCKHCKKKFHGPCLYKWFDSKDAPTCPHCRASFL